MKQTFQIDGRLPSYNDLHKPWYISRRIKQQAMDTVMWYARIARIRPITGKCKVALICYEPNRRRDPDNVSSGARKVVLDALQQMGVLHGDGQKYVSSAINDEVRVDKDHPRVEVIIYE